MKNKNPETLQVEAIYFFLGRNWLITIHSSEVNLEELVERLFKIKDETIKQTNIDALYYNILAEIVTKYEQLLTGLELSVNEYQRRSFIRPLPEIFESIDILSRQAITLRRQFWHARKIINFILHTEKDKEDVKYIEMVYDDISQLIDFVESYEGTINSIRELYVAKVSLQINDTMRVLTIFTAILLPLTLLDWYIRYEWNRLNEHYNDSYRFFCCNDNDGLHIDWFDYVFYKETLDTSWW